MKTVDQVQKEIRETNKFNNFMNEGEEGYTDYEKEKKSCEELYAALQEEFKKKWTLEYFNIQKEKWNKHTKMGVNILKIQQITGIKMDDMIKAKKLLMS